MRLVSHLLSASSLTDLIRILAVDKNKKNLLSGAATVPDFPQESRWHRQSCCSRWPIPTRSTDGLPFVRLPSHLQAIALQAGNKVHLIIVVYPSKLMYKQIATHTQDKRQTGCSV